MIAKEEKEKIVEALTRKAPSLECPMCHHRHFILAEGYTMLAIQDVKDQMILGGTMMPAIGLACSRCGFISLHSLGVLGLMEKEVKAENEKQKRQK